MATASRSLPADVMQLVCEQLGYLQDFGTLFNCALSGRDNSLSKLAIENLYRIHDKLSVVAGDDSVLPSHGTTWEARTKEQRTNIAMWALQWKSIIQSSLSSTFYPYCLYIRSLELSNLEDLLREDIFREAVSESFFSGDMAKFSKVNEIPVKKKLRGKKNVYQRIDVAFVLDLVGESITSYLSTIATSQHAEVALETLSGHINSPSLQRWASHLPRLKSLTLFDGAVLTKDVANSINNTCFGFEDLTIFNCDAGTGTSAEVDSNLAAFFSELRSHTLKSFDAISARHIGPETLLALNNHSHSLKVLKFGGLDYDAIKNLSYLQGCQMLETLSIVDQQGVNNPEITGDEVVTELVAWLTACKNLQSLSITNLASAPAILERVCLTNDIHLKDLELGGYTLLNNTAFHRALSHQTALVSLKLKADADDAFRDDIDTLIDSLGCLKELRMLNLVSTADYFGTSEISRVMRHLLKLEEFWFSGYEVTDLIWPHVAKLTNLKSFNCHALSSFKADGILNCISTLGKGNQGLLLSVMNQTLEHALSDKDLARVRLSLAERVDGQFEYVLFRDYESTDESFSD